MPATSPLLASEGLDLRRISVQATCPGEFKVPVAPATLPSRDASEGLDRVRARAYTANRVHDAAAARSAWLTRYSIFYPCSADAISAVPRSAGTAQALHTVSRTSLRGGSPHRILKELPVHVWHATLMRRQGGSSCCTIVRRRRLRSSSAASYSSYQQVSMDR